MKIFSKYLKPSQIGSIYIVGAGVLFFASAITIMTVLEPEKTERKAKPMVENVITERNSREFGLDAVNDKVAVQTRELEEQSSELEQIRLENEKLQGELDQYAQDRKAQSRLFSELSEKVSDLEASRNQKPQTSLVDYQKSEKPEPKPTPTVNAKHPELTVNTERRQIKNTGFSYGGSPTTSDVTPKSDVTATTGIQGNTFTVSDHRTESLFTVVESSIATTTSDEKPAIYLPKGAILTGVLLTGLDAPTAAAAADSPLPVLVRIKKEAILPNYATLREVDECFALMAGYGDLSSERAMLRGESITCVRKDKSVIEADFRSFVVGEDGKNGLKGTLVTRNSSVLTNAMLAGFASGMSSMFSVSPVPVISTDVTGTKQYDSVFNADAVQGGAAVGASEAMNRLADYYMNLADAIHPVIEVGAGRVVDIVVTSGATL